MTPATPEPIKAWRGHTLPALPPEYAWFLFAGTPAVRKMTVPLEDWVHHPHGWASFVAEGIEIEIFSGQSVRCGHMDSFSTDQISEALGVLAQWFWLGVAA